MPPQPEPSVLATGGRRDAARMSSIASAADLPTLDVLNGLDLPGTSSVIDIGCGNGSLARSMAVGLVPDGHVVALDQDTAAAADAGPFPENVTLIRSDVRTYAPVTPFDLIHARFVLAHLPDRRAVLEMLWSWLAPGGCIVITEPSELPIGPAAPEAVQTVFSAYHRWVREHGMSFDFAADAPGILSRLGARHVTVHTRTSRFGGGHSVDRWLPLITPVADHLVDHGVDDETMDRFAAAAADERTFVIPQIIVTTCGRSPAGGD